MALLVLLAISLLSIVLMMSLQVETKMTGQTMRHAQALNAAEAGIAEAIIRIRNEDVPDNGSPLMATQIFLAPAGSVPAAGPDSFALPTSQPVGKYLTYSTAEKGPDALTVTYKTDPLRQVIYRYDPSKPDPVQPNTGFPIFVITATGRKGQEIRRVRSEVVRKPFNAKINAAVAVDKGLDFSGSAQVCGYNHEFDTPIFTEGVHDGIADDCDLNETGAGNLPAGWCAQDITSTGSATQAGLPVTNAQNQPGFYAGPWEALGVTQAEFLAWIGSPVASIPNNPVGIYYQDNNSVPGDQSGSFTSPSGNGEGLLYIDGDVTINGNFSFKGLVYVEGDVKISGNCWILGALIIRGKGRVKLAVGSMVILYSSEAISHLAKYGGQFTTLSWREVP
jgi:hypothetical protein